MARQPAPSRPTLVVAANDPWGIVNHRAGLIRALQRAGYRIAVLAPEGPYTAGVRDLGVDFYPVPISPRGTSPVADLRTLIGFWRLLKRIRPAAFLGFTSKPNIYGSIAARLRGVPSINNVSGLGTVFTSETLLTRLVTMLYWLAFRRSILVFFQNRDDLDLFVKCGLVSGRQAALLPGSGVDLDHFAPVTRAGNPAAFTFLLSTRLLWDKGVGEFVEAARRLRAKYGHARFQVLGIVGPESAATVPLGWLREREADGIIDYLGATDDVRPVLGKADCVVLPSYYREGVPRVLLEASAMAIPVITADMPGCRDAVDDGATGFLCAARSVDSLASAMERMIRMSPQERVAMGAAARRKMERQFGEEIVHRAYIDALGKLGGSTS